MGVKSKVWAIVLLLLIFIVGCSSPSKNGKFTGLAFSSPIKTCKEVQVPYQVTEDYEIPLKFEVISAIQDWTSPGFDYYTTLTIKVKNVDSETGTPFSVIAYFQTLNDVEKSYTNTYYIMPGEIKDFYFKYDSDLGEDVKARYIVNPGQKSMTRTVTKYRTEEKCN